jgi:hypothetical protein
MIMACDESRLLLVVMLNQFSTKKTDLCFRPENKLYEINEKK